MRKLIFPILLLLLPAMSCLSPVAAEEGNHPAEQQKCLECHGRKGIRITFRNGESLAAYLNPEAFRTSAHAHLPCSACHTDFSSGAHPERIFVSRKQYRIRATIVCRRCHSTDQLKSKPVHAGILRDYSEGISPVCTDCHDSHSTLPVKGGRILSSEKEYCLNCHSGSSKMVFRDGEQLPLEVDPLSLQTSVHRELSCSDCHFGFSSKEHPRRNFRTRRDFVIANSETCRRCHFDKYTQTIESIHFAQLTQGNLAAPVCTDCHGSHSVGEGRVEKIASGKRCKKCHENIYDIYAQSVHGKALLDEHNQDVPICVDCHKAHDIGNPRTKEYRERIPEMCGNCHSNREIVGKYGLSTDVLKTYLSDFHGVTLGFYRKQEEANEPGRPIAVCTDCHGIHNITRTIGPDATIIKANLVKRCGKCHKNANANFPNAWLPHYEASMNKAPLVYIINLIYKILMPVMVIGLLLQILLHVWRYAINR
jgi:hypothetical protein